MLTPPCQIRNENENSVEARRKSSKNFLTLIVRCKDEPFVSEFVDHYLSEGVDEIYIFDDGSVFDYPDAVKCNEKVFILQDDILFKIFPTPTQSVQARAFGLSTEWMIYVDADEYITSRQNREKTIRQELQSTFRNADCVKVPWVMMSANGRQNNPESLLIDTTWRWDHDRRHENVLTDHRKFRCRFEKIEIKSIFRPDKFEFMADHHPHGAGEGIVCVDSVENLHSPLGPFHKGLREVSISRAFLVCYHYRTYSVESTLQKMKSNRFYKQYRLEDIMSADYPEIIDETLKQKVLSRKA